MKKVIYILFVFLTAALGYGCTEEFVGQPAVDKVAPGQVKNPVAESIPGGAKITYELPDDADLLYVKAVWTINGVEKNATASLHYRSLEIKGFGNTDPQTVALYSVDRSENLSNPVSVSIIPGPPPVTSILESLSMVNAFGGIQLTWKNETKDDISIIVQGKNSIGELTEIEVIYTNSTDGKYVVRNLPAVKREFAVYVRDRWDNISATKNQVLTPLFEEKLNKKLFARKLLPGDNPSERPTGSSGGGWDNLYDDDLGISNWSFWYANIGQSPIFFTIDLGITAKLSRYALWHFMNSYSYMYSGHENLKYWKVYGTNTLSAETSLDYWTATAEGTGWKQDWTMLADCESFKPSGMAPGSPVTQEDRDYATRGFQFDFPLEAPPMRYLRFHVTGTWHGGDSFLIGEVTFWGQNR
ncbi:hypothetical protein AGMMS49965_01090 [Bacteroidia bacterium]|nr:hypothetical protein AGMMS49965_01090 [Bacteroidia bacterium]